MNAKVATKNETKTALLQVGMEMMMEKGYTNTGIQEVLTTLGVPKGSFYHYFESKENYGVEIIHFFDQDYSARLMRTMRNPQKTPLERLRAYCEESKAMFAAQECRKGCLIGNLSQEMSDQSEVLRKELSIVISKWRDMIAECIAEGQKAGQITTKASAHDLAEFFSAVWGGAVMRAKTVKTTEPMDIVLNVLFEGVLKA